MHGLLHVVATLAETLTETLSEWHRARSLLDIGYEATLMGTAVIAATHGGCTGGVAHVAIFQSEQMPVAHDAAGNVVVGKAHGDAVFIDDFNCKDVEPLPIPPLKGREFCDRLLRYAQSIGTTRGTDFVEGGSLPFREGLGVGFGAQNAWRIGYVPITDVCGTVESGRAANGIAV